MGGRRYYYPPVTDEDTGVQRRQAPVRGYYTATGGRRPASRAGVPADSLPWPGRGFLLPQSHHL